MPHPRQTHEHFHPLKKTGTPKFFSKSLIQRSVTQREKNDFCELGTKLRVFIPLHQVFSGQFLMKTTQWRIHAFIVMPHHGNQFSPDNKTGISLS
jgi:hypothetical protein